MGIWSCSSRKVCPKCLWTGASDEYCPFCHIRI